MSIFAPAGGFSTFPLGKQILASTLSVALVSTMLAQSSWAVQDTQAPPPSGEAAHAQGPAYAQQSPEQLQRLVAPIALYPDSLARRFWPLRASGVMTFIVGEDGVVHRKDLGSNTAALAKAMKEYNPDSSWKRNEDQQEAADQQKTN